MKTDISEDGDKYRLSMELPGYNKDDVKIALDDGYLTVTATKETSNDEEKQNYVHKERYFGECRRSFYVGEGIDENNIKARFENGVLDVSFPKAASKEIEQKKYIAIE
ncbi:putative Hsp20 family chaperone [bioreactor metagenome]|uniref:Putative Hsp20 family chaperone n=1 Tax=bioreactor metagenome TaxID=1076179 RepID=A0A645G3E9_9ZZZZ